MFKSSVQWKIVTMLLLVVLSIIMVFGIVMKEQISNFYLNRFEEEISIAFLKKIKKTPLFVDKKAKIEDNIGKKITR